MAQIDWKKNVTIAWFGNFLTGASYSLVMPFMALYVEELGARHGMVEFYAGLAVAIAALASGIFAPFWGRLADQYGRKLMMVRAAFIMTFTMGGLAFVPNVFWLLFLRLLNGIFSGYVPNANALIASQAPKEKAGQALGLLATGVIGGSLIGPLFGGFLAELIGIRQVFLLVGLLLFVVSLLTLLMIKEEFTPITRQTAQTRQQIFNSVTDKRLLIGLFVTSMIIQISAQSVAPIFPLYIRYLGTTENIMFVSGVIVSAVGISSMLASSRLGRLGDKIGHHRLILAGLIYCMVLYLLLAQADNTVQLGILRFLFGFGTGALLPAVNALLTKITPKENISTIFSYNQMMTNFGQVIGPFVGSTVATVLGFHWVFYVTAGIVAINAIWSFIHFRNYMGSREL